MSGSSCEGEPEELDDDVQPSSVGSGGNLELSVEHSSVVSDDVEQSSVVGNVVEHHFHGR